MTEDKLLAYVMENEGNGEGVSYTQMRDEFVPDTCALATFLKIKIAVEDSGKLYSIRAKTRPYYPRYYVFEEEKSRLRSDAHLAELVRLMQQERARSPKEMEKIIKDLERKLAKSSMEVSLQKLSEMKLPHNETIHKMFELDIFKHAGYAEEKAKDPENFPLIFALRSAERLDNISIDPSLEDEIKKLGLSAEVEVTTMPQESVYVTDPEGIVRFRREFLLGTLSMGWKILVKPPIEGKVVIGRYKDVGDWREEQIKEKLQLMKEQSGLSDNEWKKVSYSARTALLAGLTIKAALSIILDEVPQHTIDLSKV